MHEKAKETRWERKQKLVQTGVEDTGEDGRIRYRKKIKDTGNIKKIKDTGNVKKIKDTENVKKYQGYRKHETQKDQGSKKRKKDEHPENAKKISTLKRKKRSRIQEA